VWLQKKPFPALIEGLTGDQTRATCVPRSGANHSDIYYEYDEKFLKGYNFVNFLNIFEKFISFDKFIFLTNWIVLKILKHGGEGEEGDERDLQFLYQMQPCRIKVASGKK
jgi:hypothetical protein